jgi:hypothetical protein
MTVEWLVKRRLGVACFLVLSPSSRGCRNSTEAHAAQTEMLREQPEPAP